MLTVGLGADTLGALATVARPRRYPAGSILCRQGDVATGLDLMESGRAVATVITATGVEVTLGTLGPGDVVGEMSVLPGSAEHRATVRAVAETRTLFVGKADLNHLQLRHPELAELVAQALARRLDTLAESLVEGLAGTAEQRILRKLAALGEKSADASSGVSVTQAELGRLTGTARGTVNRVLRREVEIGTLRVGRGRITLIDPAALRARVGAGQAAGEGHAGVGAVAAVEERRVASVLVLGIEVDSGGADVEDARSELARHVAVARNEIQRAGGHMAGIQGDTAVASFGAPVARGDDANRAVTAGAAAVMALNRAGKQARLVARAGVATGEILLAQGRVEHGVLEQAAARLRSAAPAGGVLVDDTTWVATERSHAYLRRPEGWLLATGAPPAPARLSPFVGRAGEMRQLRASWEVIVSDRRTQLVTILGMPGTGKSRLAAEFARFIVDSGGHVLIGRSQSIGGGDGYGAFVQMLMAACGATTDDRAREVIGKLEATVAGYLSDDPPEVASHLALMAGLVETSVRPDQQALFRSACRFVEGLGRDRPSLLVFEDVNWAGASLQDLIKAVASRVRGAPVMVLALARPELLDARPDWSGGLSSALTIELGGLSGSEASELAAAIMPAGDAPTTGEHVVEIAEGNPLFIEELVATVAERGGSVSESGLPANVVTSIEARLDALPDAARRVVITAAVVGRVFWRGTVASAAPRTHLDDLLDQLQARGFIRREPVTRFPGDVEYAFKHVLVRDVAYAMVPRQVRSRTHAEVARYLEQRIGEPRGEALVVLAHHWREAGERERALRYLITAAEQAGRSAAHREAVVLLRDAIDLSTELRRHDVLELRARLGIALARIGRWHEARAELETAASGLTGQVERKIQVLIELAQACHWLLDLESCRRNGGVALDLARGAGCRELEAAALGAVALADSAAGEVATSLDHMRTAIAAASGARFQLLGPTFELYTLALYWTGRAAEAVPMGEAALQIGEEFADVNTAIRTLGNMGLALAASGRYREAFATFDRAAVFGREYGTATFLTRALAMRGGVHLDLFDYETAESLAEQAREQAASLGFPLPVVSAGIDLLFNWTRTGQIGRAETLVPHVEAAVATAQGAHGWLWRLRFAQARAELAVGRGDWEEAERRARDAIGQARRTSRLKYEAAAASTLATALARRGRGREAARAALAATRSATALGDLALTVRLAAQLKDIMPNDSLTIAANAAVGAIAGSLPEGDTKRRFLGSDVVARASIRSVRAEVAGRPPGA